MTRTWLSIAEVQIVTGWSRRHILRMNGELASKANPEHRGGGRKSRLYDLASLPANAQRKYMERATALVVAERGGLVKNDAGQADLFSAQATASAALRALSDEQIKEARERERAIQPLIAWCRDGVKASGYATSNELAQAIARERQMSASSVWNWYAKFCRHGLPGLARKVREDKGGSRFFAEHSKAAEFCQAKYLRERLSIALVHEALSREWGRLYNHGSSAPSYNTVRAYLTSLPMPVTTLAREGGRAFDEKCAPYLLRKIEDVPVLQVLVGDHGKHDVWVWNDGFFPATDPNIAVRPWLTAWMDMRSRKVWGVWCLTPSSYTATSALRLVLADGVPEQVYIDNGKDYQSIGKIDYAPETSGVLARLGIRAQYCLPRHPQSKLIESWFATVRKRFDALWSPFYCGSSPQRRPEECDLALREHQKFKAGKARSTPLPRAAEFVAIARHWVAEEFNANYRAHTGRGMDGQTPNEVFEALCAPERRTLTDPAVLDLLLWDRKERVVSEGGAIELYRQRYQPADAQSAANLTLSIGRKVQVACDPLDLGRAVVFSIDGTVAPAGMPLARIEAQELVAHGPIAQEQVKQSMRERRFVKRTIKEYVANIGRDVESERDILRRHAGVTRELQGDEQPMVRRLAAAVGQGTAAPAPFIDDVVDDVKKLMEGGD